MRPLGGPVLLRIAALLCATTMAHALPLQAQEALPAPVAAALKSAGLPPSSAAIVVQETGGPRPMLSVNAGAAMNPASTMKLVTTFAALELLGPTFSWKTEAHAAGLLAGEVLEGDLVLRGGGDPRLTIENLWLLLRSLRARGLREIRGDLVLDRSYFEPVDQDSARFDNQSNRPYNVAPDALLVNFKAVRFSFIPDPVTRAVMVAPEPRMANLEVQSTVRASDAACGDWRAQLKAEFLPLNGAGTAAQGGVRAVFSGNYPASCGERIWNLALFNNTSFTAGVFRQLWQEVGGSFSGTVREGTVPPGARLLATQESPALTEVVRDINKFSNNVMARQLYLTLGAERLKQPGRADRSGEVVKSWLNDRGLAIPELVIENGSGLSRIERISAGNLTRLLLAAWASPVMPELVSSLPVVALDGTMRRRMRFDPVAGQAHIKTGSLEGVCAIAGYTLSASGKRYALSFLVNHPNAAAAQAAQDALLRWVWTNG